MQSIPIAIFGFSMVLTALLPWPEGLHVYSIPYGRNIMMLLGIVVEITAVWCGLTERKDWERWMGKAKKK